MLLLCMAWLKESFFISHLSQSMLHSRQVTYPFVSIPQSIKSLKQFCMCTFSRYWYNVFGMVYFIESLRNFILLKLLESLIALSSFNDFTLVSIVDKLVVPAIGSRGQLLSFWSYSPIHMKKLLSMYSSTLLTVDGPEVSFIQYSLKFHYSLFRMHSLPLFTWRTFQDAHFSTTHGKLLYC